MNRAGASGIDRKDASQFFFFATSSSSQIDWILQRRKTKKTSCWGGNYHTAFHASLLLPTAKPINVSKDWSFFFIQSCELFLSYLCVGDGWERIVDTGSLCGHGE